MVNLSHKLQSHHLPPAHELFSKFCKWLWNNHLIDMYMSRIYWQTVLHILGLPPPRSIFNTVNMSTSGICIWISSIGIDMQINMPIMMDERAREANQSTVGIQGRGWCYAKICGSRKDNANKQYWWGIKEIKFPSPTWRDCLIRLSLLAAAPICSLILIYV